MHEIHMDENPGLLFPVVAGTEIQRCFVLILIFHTSIN